MVATVVGWLAWIAVDRVYDPVRRPRLPRVHSADVLGMAALLTVVILGQVWLAVILGGIRLLMFGLGLRTIESSVSRQSIRTAVRVTPLLLGLVLMGEGGNSWRSLVLIGLGEIADRVFFYLDLAPTTFAETIESDFLAATR